jgi:hypothetical protein
MKFYPEDKLIKTVDRVIEQVNTGTLPSDAVEKVARDESLNPQQIFLVATAFNKSRSVAFMKNASSDSRSSNFDLANPEKIIRAVFKSEPMSKVAFELPKANLSTMTQIAGAAQAPIEKAASADPVEGESPIFTRYWRNRSLTAASFVGEVSKYEILKEAVEKKLSDAYNQTLIQFHLSLDKLAAEFRQLQKDDIPAIVQRIVNGYPETAGSLLKAVAYQTRQDLPTLQKTANAAVFPPKQPYLTVCEVYSKAHQLRDAKNALVAFHKEAFDGVFLGTALGNLVADQTKNTLIEGAGDVSKALLGSATAESSSDYPSPQLINGLKELESKKNFMQVALYDPDLKKYKINDLINAHNTVNQLAPDYISNTPVYRNLMLRVLETGGRMDPFELKTITDLQGAGEKSKVTKLQAQTLKKELAGDEKPAPLKWPGGSGGGDKGGDKKGGSKGAMFNISLGGGKGGGKKPSKSKHGDDAEKEGSEFDVVAGLTP